MTLSIIIISLMVITCTSITIISMILANNTSNKAQEDSIINELRADINTLRSEQKDLLDEMDSLIEKVSILESSLSDEKEENKFYRMKLDSFYSYLDGQEDYFDSRINEVIRLHNSNELEEIVYLVEDYDFEELHITVKNQKNEILKYAVSEECKVLVVGQTFIIYQTLEEGIDFMDSVKQDDGNKVILVIKDNVVEQIKMYGYSDWN